jgi:ketosteroid isomerase-like protein
MEAPRFVTDQIVTAQIAAARDAINRAIAARDAAGIVAWLQPHYHVVTSAGTHRNGREASATSWTELFATDPAATYLRLPDEIHVNELGMAQEHGRWTGAITTENGVVTLAGVYAARWHRTEGGWRLEAEMFTALGA